MAKPASLAKPAVGLFAKPPRPGAVKTRLCPPLSVERAAALYGAFLGDLAEMLDGDTAWDWIVYSPEPEILEATWPSGAPRPHAWRRQPEHDLGERMNAALEELLVENRPAAILLGSDHPTVTRDMIARAFNALERADVVLGPSFDGGLYLVGWSRMHPEIFRDVPWSTERVLETVLMRVKAHDVQAAFMMPWYDVDDAHDLEFLRTHLCALELELGPNAPCPRTRAALTGGI
ncbi:MAG TPA: TIGR04282 family arsenosugar biosynthesis glycosyltransferase [Dongiaceae bacterium]|nr:TIGR04282 family arsenosugar biosynthesis glycosyltransferase [Dongiaceae bacterium]